ncbi:MAG: hypothetical protein ABSB59_43815 [Streptosporangiaceae bacterium]
MTANPFEILGLPERPDLDDETVRAAWRAIAAATAAFTELRTPWARSEAYADLLDARDGTFPLPVITDSGPISLLDLIADPGPIPPPHRLAEVWQLPARIWHGRRLHIAARALAAALLSLTVLTLIPGQPAEPAVITGLIIWFVLTSRGDLAPPPGQ